MSFTPTEGILPIFPSKRMVVQPSKMTSISSPLWKIVWRFFYKKSAPCPVVVFIFSSGTHIGQTFGILFSSENFSLISIGYDPDANSSLCGQNPTLPGFLEYPQLLPAGRPDHTPVLFFRANLWQIVLLNGPQCFLWQKPYCRPVSPVSIPGQKPFDTLQRIVVNGFKERLPLRRSCIIPQVEIIILRQFVDHFLQNGKPPHSQVKHANGEACAYCKCIPAKTNYPVFGVISINILYKGVIYFPVWHLTFRRPRLLSNHPHRELSVAHLW